MKISNSLIKLAFWVFLISCLITLNSALPEGSRVDQKIKAAFDSQNTSLENRLKSETDLEEAEISELKNQIAEDQKKGLDLKDLVNIALAEQVKYITFLSYLTAVVIGCVAIVFAAGVFFVHKENSFLVGKVKDELQECRDLKGDFENWFKGQDKEIKKTFAYELKAYQREAENLNNYNFLKTILDQPALNPTEVFSRLTPLIVDTKVFYKPLFEKIIQLNIDPDINKKAQEGIDQIMTLSKSESEKSG